ncbi:hypothetical protein Hanom_Chr09g00774131 [Helianthus anomalus]
MNKDKVKYTPHVWSKYMKNVLDKVLELKRMKEELITADCGSKKSGINVERRQSHVQLKKVGRVEKERSKDTTKT